jgi:four helix bundle protein
VITNFEIAQKSLLYGSFVSIRRYLRRLKRVIGKQILRSGTSVAANYREASRARSDAELVSTLSIVEQELDESLLWMELLVESGITPEPKLTELRGECEELLCMTVASIKTLKSR